MATEKLFRIIFYLKNQVVGHSRERSKWAFALAQFILKVLDVCQMYCT